MTLGCTYILTQFLSLSPMCSVCSLCLSLSSAQASEFSRNTPSWQSCCLYLKNKTVEISHFNHHTKHYGICKFALKLITAFSWFQFFSITSCTKIPVLPTLCITGKLAHIHTREVPRTHTPCHAWEQTQHDTTTQQHKDQWWHMVMHHQSKRT